MSLWKNTDFLKLWASQTVSEIGSRITREGLPMGAVLLMGVTPFTMSGLSLATQLPASLLGVFIGVWVDRLPRRPLLMFADIARAILLVSIPMAAITHHLHLWMFFVVSAATGILTLLFDVSYQAYLPWLIQRRNLVDGNQKLGVTASTAEVIGPGLTGLLVQALTAPIAIVFDAISYVVSAFFIWTIRKPETRRKPLLRSRATSSLSGHSESTQELSNWLTEVREGWSILRRNRTIFALAGAAATDGFASSALFVLDTLYALKTLHLTPFLFGLTVTMGGVGALLGALLSRHVTSRFGVGWTLIAMLIIRGVMASAWFFAGGSTWRIMSLLLLWQLVGDASGTVYGILDTTLRQTSIEDRALGRVNGTIRMLEVGLTAIGALCAGAISEVVGIRDTMLFSAIGMTLSTLWIIFSPIRHMTNIPVQATELE